MGDPQELRGRLSRQMKTTKSDELKGQEMETLKLGAYLKNHFLTTLDTKIHTHAHTHGLIQNNIYSAFTPLVFPARVYKLEVQKIKAL